MGCGEMYQYNNLSENKQINIAVVLFTFVSLIVEVLTGPFG